MLCCFFIENNGSFVFLYPLLLEELALLKGMLSDVFHEGKVSFISSSAES